VWDLDGKAFWVDEAESAINALTILQHGYPTDTYLGLPIYENMLVRSWPGNPEYEFRDVSYSDSHYAIYHGWLPLYSIAGAFAVSGVRPDVDDGSRTVKHNLSDRKRRTKVARLPAVIAGSLFLLVVFVGGKIMFGRDAAWAAILVAAIHPWHVFVSRQARYYSLEVLLTTMSSIALWFLLRRCRWKDVYLAAFSFVLLFHTHVLSFLTAAAVTVLCAPFILLRHPFALRKLAVFAFLAGAGTVPWIVVTRFYRHQGIIPAAWSMLKLPNDLILFPPLKPIYLFMGLLVCLFTTYATLSKTSVPDRWRKPFTRLAPVLIFLCAWMVCGYGLFFRFVPAASFAWRMTIVYWGPLLLLAAGICASFVQAVTTRYRELATSLLMLILFFCTGHNALSAPVSFGHPWQDDSIVLNYIDSLHLNSDSRLYASPNNHLIFTFYSGLPVQSITPIRKSFLNSYQGDIVFIDDAAWALSDATLTPELVRRVANEGGESLSAEGAEHWCLLLATRIYREGMLRAVGFDRPAQLETLPAFAQKLLKRQERISLLPADAFFTRGFDIRTWADWRSIYFYRFVDPYEHRGPLANFAERLRGTEGMVLSRSAVVYYSKWRPPGTAGGLSFRFSH
jgi:hypothetical protein